MKIKSLLLSLFVAVSVSLSACGGDDDEPQVSTTLTVNPETVSFTAAGGSATVQVTGPEWSTKLFEAWVSVKASTSTLTITAKENTSLKSRTAKIEVFSGSASKIIEVKQDGKTPAPVDPTIVVPEGYALVWNDEFDTPGSLGKDWTHEQQGPGWVNNELQTYVKESFNGSRVTEVVDGHLAITCFKKGNSVYSGRVYANVNSGWTYGIFEARIKLPGGKGTWPAFWMMPVNNDFSKNPWPRCGEIDIMEEVGVDANRTSSSIHCQSYNHTIGTQKTAERYTEGAEDDYHVYRLEWTPNYIKTYVDDHALLTFYNDGQGNVDTWPFDKPFYIILNLAWGGDWGGYKGVDESALPATMEVDYVRVFQAL